MNNIKGVFGIALVLVVGFGVYYFIKSFYAPAQVSTTTSAFPTGVMPEEQLLTTPIVTIEDRQSGYIPYTKEVFSVASNQRRVLFFYASWCPTCRPADADFTANGGKIPSDMTVIRVNYNDPDTDEEEKALAKLYGVTYQHTFVQIDTLGREVTKWNGGQFDQLLANTK